MIVLLLIIIILILLFGADKVKGGASKLFDGCAGLLGTIIIIFILYMGFVIAKNIVQKIINMGWINILLFIILPITCLIFLLYLFGVIVEGIEKKKKKKSDKAKYLIFNTKKHNKKLP